MVEKLRNSNYRSLVGIMLFGVLLRVVSALLMGNQVVELPGIHDQISYHALALRLFEGHGYSFQVGWYPFTPPDTPTAHWSFIYPAYLMGVYRLFGVHPLVARLLQTVVVGCLSCLLVYILTRRIFGASVGLVSAGVTSVYVYFIYYGSALTTESFFMLAGLLVIESAYRLVQHPSFGLALLLGLFSGLAVLLRQTFLFYLPVLLLWLLWQSKGKLKLYQLALPVMIVIACIAPWTVRNHRVYGQFLLLNSNAGYALYSSVHPSLGTEWTPSTAVTPVPEEWFGFNEAQLDRKLTQAGVQFILKDPGRYILLTLSKFKEQFKFWPSADSSTMSNILRLFSFTLLLPLSVYGIFLARKHLLESAPLLLFFALISTVHLLTWPSARYRVPTDACLVPFAALALNCLYYKLVSHRTLGKI